MAELTKSELNNKVANLLRGNRGFESTEVIIVRVGLNKLTVHELKIMYILLKEKFVNHTITIREVKNMRLKYSDRVIIAISGDPTKTDGSIKKLVKRANSHLFAVYRKGVHILETMDIGRAVKTYNSIEA